MTERTRNEISVQRLSIFDRDNWICQVCGEPILLFGSPQLGHRIKQSKENIAKYGKHIIHHAENMASVCGLDCNARVDLGANYKEIEELADRIKYQVEMEKLTSKDIWQT
jgi:5-methylcytosine-specific restriction endonuclease McrA